MIANAALPGVNITSVSDCVAARAPSPSWYLDAWSEERKHRCAIDATTRRVIAQTARDRPRAGRGVTDGISDAADLDGDGVDEAVVYEGHGDYDRVEGTFLVVYRLDGAAFVEAGRVRIYYNDTTVRESGQKLVCDAKVDLGAPDDAGVRTVTVTGTYIEAEPDALDPAEVGCISGSRDFVLRDGKLSRKRRAR